LLLQRLEIVRRRLTEIAESRVFRMPFERLHEHERRLDDCDERLGRAVQQYMRQASERLASQAARLETLSPLNVLSRGYSLTRREADQTVVRNAQDVAPGERLLTDVRHGRILSRVEEVDASARLAPSAPHG
jgi:exodeoxyribonuclease VII large subunit